MIPVGLPDLPQSSNKTSAHAPHYYTTPVYYTREKVKSNKGVKGLQDDNAAAQLIINSVIIFNSRKMKAALFHDCNVLRSFSSFHCVVIEIMLITTIRLDTTLCSSQADFPQDS